jgi:hypothetical protein
VEAVEQQMAMLAVLLDRVLAAQGAVEMVVRGPEPHRLLGTGLPEQRIPGEVEVAEVDRLLLVLMMPMVVMEEAGL